MKKGNGNVRIFNEDKELIFEGEVLEGKKMEKVENTMKIIIIYYLKENI